MINNIDKLLKDIREHTGSNITVDLVDEHFECGMKWYRIDLTDNIHDNVRWFDVCGDLLLDEQNIEQLALDIAQNAMDYFNSRYQLERYLDRRFGIVK